MYRLELAAAIMFLVVGSARGQGLAPDEAVTRMKLPEGFSARCVAHEPMIRQPVSISFDNRGRLWVLQYLQYPNYAGLKPVKQDQYLRTLWDKLPEPPPHGPRGADKLTILFDPDEHGVFRQSKDFVTGLNIASGFCLGNCGVYVVQPPYLLFYPDKDEDDVPDREPEVLLTGFGMEDTHSLANSLQWGPDGWLYGAAGSTSTCKIANPANPKDIVEFQQGVWRYHPKSRKFELFSEGGGNTYGLDFDQNGQVIAGTNWGGFAMLHQMQGAYYVKGFAKHGPLHHPHAYGYFEHVPYQGFKGGHVTCGGIVYQADTYPKEFQNRYIAANLLSNAIYWHRLEPFKSTFKASHGGELIEGNDPWFRPVDLLQGPDGCVYVVDFYDRRAAHLDPIDNWDKSNGRIYRIEYKGGPKYETFDLRRRTPAQLAELMKHPNKWWRNEARRLIVDRNETGAHPKLRKLLLNESGQAALESLWTLYASGGWIERDFDAVESHPNEYVRAWAIRFLADDGVIPPLTFDVLQRMSTTERSHPVLAQLACSARRLSAMQASDLVAPMMNNPLASDDPQLPLLIWWGLEYANAKDTTDTIRFPYSDNPKLRDFFAERVARRFLSGDIPRGAERCSTLFELTFGSQADPIPVLRGIATALQSHPLESIPEPLKPALERLRKERPNELLLLEVLARMNDSAGRAVLRSIVSDSNATEQNRLKSIDLLRQVRDVDADGLFLQQLLLVKSDGIRLGLLAGLEVFDSPRIAETILANYARFSPTVKRRAIQTLVARAVWARILLKAVENGLFAKAEISTDNARAAMLLDDKEVISLVEKHFGKLTGATPGEKLARIAWLNTVLNREKGEAERGKVLYVKHCAACHQLHGEGGKVGPDLTTADRKNRGYLLAQIVDPSGYIRPEFLVQTVLTLDERKLSGIAKEVGESIELTNWIDEKVYTSVIPKKDIADIRPSSASLMPEKMLDSMNEQEIANLFAYLSSEPPLQPKSQPVANPLRICLVSGSLEYKSDESLSAFKKYLESNFHVECTMVSAKAEKDKSLAGIENLEKCDVAIFFTRRLQIEGDSLDAVKKFAKSGKPLIGIRTASHGFQNWLEMDKEVYGGDYKNHFSGNVVCEVKPNEKGKEHPILKGITAFKSKGSLYKNPNLASDVTVLLTGSIPDQSESVAWVREREGRRIFYTSLGHPGDFQDANFTRLLVNAMEWVTKTELKTRK